MATIVELRKSVSERGVATRHLWVASEQGRRVPALVFTPEDAAGPRPVVLLGHGAGGSKDEPQMQRIARWFVRSEGWAVVAIDGPVHGERRKSTNGNVGLEARQALVSRATYDEMAVDWQRTLDACGELEDVGNERAAYLGFSMGSVLGIQAVASEPRLRCAVFAIGGVLSEERNFLVDAATQITIPVLMINQSEDEIFSRESAFRLYDALAGPKRIIFHPGRHQEVPREGMERVREFLHAHLVEAADSDAPPGAW